MVWGLSRPCLAGLSCCASSSLVTSCVFLIASVPAFLVPSEVCKPCTLCKKSCVA